MWSRQLAFHRFTTRNKCFPQVIQDVYTTKSHILQSGIVGVIFNDIVLRRARAPDLEHLLESNSDFHIRRFFPTTLFRFSPRSNTFYKPEHYVYCKPYGFCIASYALLKEKTNSTDATAELLKPISSIEIYRRTLWIMCKRNGGRQMYVRGRHMFTDSRVRPFNGTIRPVGSHEYVHMRIFSRSWSWSFNLEMRLAYVLPGNRVKSDTPRLCIVTQ